MDSGWLALAVAVTIVFVFFVLVQHWHRVVRHQAWLIRCLSQRVQDLESISDSGFVRRLSEAAPMPLEQVFTFSFRMEDCFWSGVLGLSAEEKKFVQKYGSFVGSVKLERWRSHTVATISEVLPESKAASWQTRTVDFYADRGANSDAWTLWELRLARPGPSAERPPSLELLLRANSVELRGHLAAKLLSTEANRHNGAGELDDVTFFRVPLDAGQLAAFRSHDPANSGNGQLSQETDSWQAFYSGRDELLGLEWQLRLHDLTKKSEWERWRILERPAIHLVSEQS
jgi:hypothetical protein